MAEITLAPNLPTVPRGTIQRVASKIGVGYQTARLRLIAGERAAWNAMFGVLREIEENAAAIRAEADRIKADAAENYRYN